ncbi:MAG: arylsulfatase A-like enzyme [Rhodothermales bacterium]|jgi:arylsulfatase A-like enzyme
MMSTARSGLLGFIALLLTVATLVGCSEPEPRRPNIIFVFSDDHAAQAVGAYGGLLASLDPTPNIDRLAAEGMLFRSAFVTNSICAPSRAVILTGKHSHLNGVPTNREVFDSTQVTFPKLLQAGGYQTAMIGKWHLKSQPTGFDYWEVLPGQGSYYNPDFRTPEGRVRESGYVTDLITDKALEWLKSGRDQEKPFMLMYQHKAPHRVWMPGPDHLTTYADVEIPEPPTLFDDYEGRTSAARTQKMSIDKDMRLAYDLKLLPNTVDPEPNWTNAAQRNYDRMDEAQRANWDAVFDPVNADFNQAELVGEDLVRWKYKRYMQDYLRSIRSVDDNLGRLLDELESSGLAENTVVIYNSDQGFFLGEHGWFDKRWMYEESLQAPLVVRWPGVVEAGSESSDLVQNLDFAQTFLDMAGIGAPEDMQGRSIVPLLRGSAPENWRDAIYYQYYEYPGPHDVQQHYGVRTDRYKLIYYYHIDEWELYDLETDPDELASVHDNPAYAEVRQRLEARLGELREQYEVPVEDPAPPVS